MTHIRTAAPATPSLRSARTSLLGTALLLSPALFMPPQHVAEGGGARVTTLWRSERALDQYAQEGLAIASAVLESMGERPEDAPLVTVGIAESSQALRYLGDPKAKERDQAKRRKRKRAQRRAREARAAEGADEAIDVPELPGSSELLWVVPGLMKADPSESTVGGAVVAMVPKVHDRVMFGTGLTPATRWGVALEVARAADPDGDILGNALSGLELAEAAYPLEQEPFSSTGLVLYQQHLRASQAADGEEERLAAMAYPTRLTLDALGPVAAPIELVARHYRAQGLTTEEVLSLEPHWLLEAGAVGRHKFGWQAVASRRADALVLTPKPLTSEPFKLSTTILLTSNDLSAPAQADFVFGDVDGARFLLVCNTKEGIYLFRRAERGGDYETLTELKEVAVPPGRPVEVQVVWADQTLVVTVGGAEMAGVVLPEEEMAGHFGFGCHAGSNVLFSEIKFE